MGRPSQSRLDRQVALRCTVPNILIWYGLHSVRVAMSGKAENRSWMLRWETGGGVLLYVAFCCGHEVDACVRPVFFVDIRVLPTHCCGLPPSQFLLTSVASLLTCRGIVVWFWAWVRNCFPLQIPQTGHGARPVCCPYSTGTDISSSWVEWPEHEAVQSPPSNVEVKNEWSCTFTPP